MQDESKTSNLDLIYFSIIKNGLSFIRIPDYLTSCIFMKIMIGVLKNMNENYAFK